MAELVARGLSIDAVRSELTPDQKTLVVLSERKNGPVMMIGDGVNDAPALAAADLGLAMGAKGAAASAEAADIVLLVDQLDRVVPAIKIARRSRFIALESVYAGIGLSVAGMIAAALGFITPVQGALFQEVIDVTVILNALRALYEPAKNLKAVSLARLHPTRIAKAVMLLRGAFPHKYDASKRKAIRSCAVLTHLHQSPNGYVSGISSIAFV